MTRKEQIDGVNYELQEMPATKRNIILLELKNIAAGAKDGIGGIDEELDYAKLIGGILDRIEPEKGAQLIYDIISNGVRFPVISSQLDFDAHFTEHYEHQIDLIAWIMELNFGKSIEKIKKKLLTTGILSMISSKNQTESEAN